MIHVAAYCRISTDKEDQANSYVSQQHYFRDYIDQNPEWELYQIYADEGITGTSTQNRRQFNQMMNDARAGCFQLIITKEVSRFSRNILDTILYTRELKSIGVGVYFMTQNLNSMDPESEMLLTIMATLAQEESRRTSVRVKWGQARQMERGVVFGTSLLGYDVKNGRIGINPKEAELVRLIFYKYGIEKKGASTIAHELMQEGYRTRSGGQKWYPAQILRILKNEKYIGDLVQKKTITPDYLSHRRTKNTVEEDMIVIRNHHEAIISRSLWETAQRERIGRNKHRKVVPRAGRYLFSGKIKCGECGQNFVCRYKYQKKEPIKRWRCYAASAKDDSHCSIGILLRDDDARIMLKTAIQGLKYNREEIVSETVSLIKKAIAATKSDQADDIRRLEHAIGQITVKKNAVLDSYFSGEISLVEMKEIKEEYDTEFTRLKQQLELLEKNAGIQRIQFRDSIENLLDGGTESDCLYQCILESMTVFKNGTIYLRLCHLQQIWNFSLSKI